jgi:anti-sigma regulatory factor (Ser/Thr protein kinase)
MSEVITLTLPQDRRFATVARIVVGGVAARLDLPYEALDDLQLAVESVLAEEGLLSPNGGEVTLEIAIDSGGLDVAIGPVDAAGGPQKLAADESALGLRTVLAAVVDDVRLDQRDGSTWVVLVKRVPVPPRA